jgi:hypothetical protein
MTTTCLALLLSGAFAGGCQPAADNAADAVNASPRPKLVAQAGGRSAAAPMAIQAGIPLDLSYVDRKSRGFASFRRWVDSAVSGSPGYAFAAGDAALLYRLTQKQAYCELAVRMVEQQVASAEAAIAGGGRPEISGDSYLEVGPRIADLSLTMDSCKTDLDDATRQRWSAYAEHAVWNVWNHASAQWGGRAHPWTGWSVDNPGNNYYYSFVEATLYWALASGSGKWMTFLRDEKLPPLQAYYAKLPGGGSLEGTGYGAAHMRLFPLYRLWRDATGQDLANANPHANDSIPYWVHATVPTLDRFAPIGDQSRSSVPELYDYHRRVVLEARQLSADEDNRALASWWLGNIALQEMSGFNSVAGLLPSGDAGAAPAALFHHATGTGHLFARSGWDKDAMWLAVVAGPYNESHAHQEHGGFTLFARDWLAVTQNIWSHSGIQQGTETNNVLRFERSDTEARQCMSPQGDRVVHQCESPGSAATLRVEDRGGGSLAIDTDLTGVYGGNPAVKSWQRRFEFGGRTLRVSDRFALGAGTRAVFQVNVPAQPRIQGNEAIAGRLRIRVLEPANATLSVHDWRTVDAQEFRRGWRLDAVGGTSSYVVELSETD